MSTQYYLVCHDCKQYIEVAKRSAGDYFASYWQNDDCARVLDKFTKDHVERQGPDPDSWHRMQLLSEHDMEGRPMRSYRAIEWGLDPDD